MEEKMKKEKLNTMLCKHRVAGSNPTISTFNNQVLTFNL